MKGSTLHRSSLTREKMGLLASLCQTEKKHNTRAQLNHYYKTAKSHELDILWGNVQKSIQRVHGATKGSSHRSPAVYLIAGFIAGVLFMSLITFIVSISTMSPKQVVKKESKSNVAIVGENALEDNLPETTVTQEKYVVKQGDTLNGIAYRFYGRYDEAKIQEIQKINNISNPQAISIGQELVIPVEQER